MNPQTWCSTKNPQGSCRPTSGICKPMDGHTLGIYKELQRQANRILYAKGKSLIGVDGRIGGGTVRAVNTALGTSFSGCDSLASVADGVLVQMRAAASRLGAPPQVQSPAPRDPPSQVSPSGKLIHPPLQSGFVGFLKSPLGLAVAAGSLLALYSISKTPKRKRKR